MKVKVERKFKNGNGMKGGKHEYICKKVVTVG
jgi:hypothetical protein